MRTKKEYDEHLRAEAIRVALLWTLVIAFVLLSGLGAEAL